MIFWIWCVVILSALVLYLRQSYSRFTRHGVKQLTPWPFVGNLGRILLRMEHIAAAIDRAYYKFPDERFIGTYEFMLPMVYLRDLDLVKKITVKDFEHFLDHRVLIDDTIDPLFGRNLFSLKGEEWKDMRSTLSPAFTSSKIRVMVPFMVEAGDHMIKALISKIESSENNHIDVDVKDLTTRYANDVIASCAFGLRVDSHTDKKNQFYIKGKEALNFNTVRALVFLFWLVFSKLIKKVTFPIFSENIRHFFKSLVLNTMKDREERHIIRPDMIHLLMEAKKGKLSHSENKTDVDAGFATVEESAIGKKYINREWSDDDLIAQAVLFFIAGFETISSALSFMVHELAVNPDIQERLVEEIKQNDAKNNGEFDYNSVQQMKYLDMVVSEVLRLWPPNVAFDRICNKDYNLGKPNSNSTEDYIIRKGEGVGFPVWAIHRDPEYFPDPLRFDPERFSEQNRHNIKPYSYMPFGHGPRNCIGSRFALCEAKVMAYQLLRNLEISPAAKTQIPVKLAPEHANLRIKGGHWARFKIRK